MEHHIFAGNTVRATRHNEVAVLRQFIDHGEGGYEVWLLFPADTDSHAVCFGSGPIAERFSLLFFQATICMLEETLHPLSPDTVAADVSALSLLWNDNWAPMERTEDMCAVVAFIARWHKQTAAAY